MHNEDGTLLYFLPVTIHTTVMHFVIDIIAGVWDLGMLGSGILFSLCAALHVYFQLGLHKHC